MSFVLATLWFERRRFLPAVLAVAFSALLVALQGGLLLGTFSIVSIPVDNTTADLWVACPEVISVDVTHPIPRNWESRLSMPEIVQVEEYYQNFAFWRKPRSGAAELVLVIGSHLHDGSLGLIHQLTPVQRRLLLEPGAVIVDEADRDRLGIRGPGEWGEVNGQRVHVVGMVRGLKGLAGPYLFCSNYTARALLWMGEDRVTYLLARCRNPADAPRIAERLNRRYAGEMTVMTRTAFSWKSRMHWLINTGGGIALLCAAALGLLVGAAITSQTLYAATVASMREYAVLYALGAPRWRMASAVLLQAFIVGVTGIVLAYPGLRILAAAALLFRAQAMLPWELLVLSAGVTLLTAMLSGLWALRSLRLVQPAMLLR